MLEREETSRLVEEAKLRSATGRHAEAVEMAARLFPPLREEVAKGGETAREALRLLFSALHTAGISSYEQHNLHAATGYFQEALQIAQEMNDMRAVGAALHEIAQIAGDWQNFEQAAELARGAVRAVTLAECEAHVAMQCLAIFDQLIGKLDEAEAVLRLVRESCEARDDLIGLGKALHELGTTAAGRNRSDEAVGYFVKAMRVKRVSGDARGLKTTSQALEEFLRRNPQAARHPLLKNAVEAM